MNLVNTFKGRLKERRVQLGLGIALIALFIIGFGGGDSAPSSSVEAKKPVVTVTTAAQLQGGTSLSLIGTVRAFTEGDITAERGGRVVSVNATLGQAVSAGQIIATLENAAEQAAVLQAQGSYEAALAGSAQSGVGVSEAATRLTSAQNAAISTINASFNTVNGTLLNNIDAFFGTPNGPILGLRIDSLGYGDTLRNDRIAFQQILPQWQAKTSTINTNSDMESELTYSRSQVERTIGMVDAFIAIFNQTGNVGGYTDAELKASSVTFTNLRSSLIGTRSSIDTALASLSAAKDGVKRAQLASSGGQASASDAQIKIALGSLRAAQASLSKTILRTPIRGTVNTLSVRVGDFVSPQTSVAKIANNKALEVITYIGESEQALLMVGDTVLIDDKESGTVAQIAPALDPVTRKIEVRIATESTGITNGNTVRITKTSASTTAQTAVYVPLTAVKFESKDGYLMNVIDGRIVKKPVVLGSILGGFVEVVEGHSNSDSFVVDVRGLLEGAEVEVAK